MDRVIFRVDGSSEIGIGHVMRCLNLAEELSRNGFEPLFCTRPEGAGLVNEILNKGFEVSEIPVFAGPEEDAKGLISVVQKYRAGIVVLDGYNFDSHYLEQIRKESRLLLSIDDIAKTFYCSDIVLNQNINASREMYFGKVGEGTKLLLGPGYALLRSEFKKLHISERKFDKVNSILVVLGGADPHNQTLKVLRALEKVSPDSEITAVLGISNLNRKSITDYAASSNNSIKILNNVKNMEELMLNADIAVSSGGSIVWELCCLGLPTLQMVLAGNQKEAAEELNRREITINLGWYAEVTEEKIAAGAAELINNPQKRTKMSHNGRAIVDGRGTGRVVSEICAFYQRVTN